VFPALEISVNLRVSPEIRRLSSCCDLFPSVQAVSARHENTICLMNRARGFGV
jgi:hypothetical protein